MDEPKGTSLNYVETTLFMDGLLPIVEKILSTWSGRDLYPSWTKLTNPDLVVFSNLNPFKPAVIFGSPCFPSMIALKKLVI